MTLSITTHEVGDHEIRVTLTGEVDCATAAELRAVFTQVLNRGPEEITVDIAGITVLDSTGIGTLVVAHQFAEEVGVRLRVLRPNRFVARLLRVMGVADRLGVSAPEGDAVLTPA